MATKTKIKVRFSKYGYMGSATRQHRDATNYRRHAKHKGKGYE